VYIKTVRSQALSKPPVRHSHLHGYYEWKSKSAPPGRRFEPIEERVLEPTVRELASRLPGSSSGVLATAEFAGPVGIADLVAVTRAQERLEERLRLGIPPLSRRADTSVVAAVAVRRATTASSVSKALGVSEVQATRRLRQLSDAGVLSQNGNGYLRNPVFIPIGHMYAFEAKVSDWRQAIAQAMRYARWADAAGIVLLRPPKDLESLKVHARALRIGVAVEDRWLIRPVLQRASPGLRLLSSEMFVAALIK